MAKKPTYRELEERVRELEKEAIKPRGVEEDLRKSEEKYRLLIDNYGNPITVFDGIGDKEVIEHGPISEMSWLKQAGG